MNKSTAGIALVCALALCFALLGCASSSSSNGSSGESASATAAEAASSESAEATASASADADAVTSAELANVDVSVEYGDFDGMSALSKEIQNGERDGQVVEVDGLVSNFARGMSYNIMEPNADDTEKVGTMFVIDGAADQPEEDVYPADETHIKIVGKVGLDPDGIYYLIHTLPEYVEILD